MPRDVTESGPELCVVPTKAVRARMVGLSDANVRDCIPVSSNYVAEAGVVVSVFRNFHPSRRPLRDHVSLDGLTDRCAVCLPADVCARLGLPPRHVDDTWLLPEWGVDGERSPEGI